MSDTLNQRLTRKQKEANNKKWFKDNIDNLDKKSFERNSYFFNNKKGLSKYKKMKVNYDLFNNIINKSDFEHVCYPFGKEVGELPADFTNKDIISGKVKALLGMEMRRPFSWKIVATNEEATTRKEQEEFNMIREFVVNTIMQPIQEQIEMEAQQQVQGQELTLEQQQQIQQQVQEELKTKTPPEIRKYMQREHQDPAEVLSNQLLQYLMQKENLKNKFNKAWKHALISGEEIFWVGGINGEPVVKVINPLRFDCDVSSESEFIEDGEWACYETYMNTSEIVKYFGTEFTPVEIDDILREVQDADHIIDEFFSPHITDQEAYNGVRVLHCEWKSLKPIKFLYGKDPMTGEEYEDLVDESYQLNKEAGDIFLHTEWIPVKYEGYKIGKDKYAFLREVPGQNKDLDSLYNCKLSYVGAIYDNLNSEATSLVDRMKYYQYMYNIIFYRIELLIASDEGKSLLLNAGLIPKSAGLDVEKWMYYFKVNKVGLMNPAEEGNRGNSDITQSAKEIDMSLVSDIQKYIQLADYIERRCGESVGITKQIEGQIGSNEAVRNTQQALIQSANILEPYFEIHNMVKRNVLQSLIECAKATYSVSQPNKLSYVLDNMSIMMINMDYELLDNSTYGIFVADSMKSDEALQMVQQLSHAAMQNRTIEMSDVIKIMRSESIQEAEEMLRTAEEERIEREQAQQQQLQQAQAEAEEKAREFKRKEWEFELEKIKLQESLRTERELQKQTILSLGFNQEKDLDNDGVPDILEVYKTGLDANIKSKKLELDRDRLEQQKKEHSDKMELEDKKMKNQILKKTIQSK